MTGKHTICLGKVSDIVPVRFYDSMSKKIYLARQVVLAERETPWSSMRGIVLIPPRRWML